MAGWKEAYKLLETHAARFKRINLISVDEATANGSKSILDLASMIGLYSSFTEACESLTNTCSVNTRARL